MRLITILFFLSFSCVLFSQNYNSPESVEYDYSNSRWLIGNTNSGQVIARDSNGKLTVFVSGIQSGPHGIEIVGDVLYCCDRNYIRGYSLSTGTEVFNLKLNAVFLNGITHDNSGNLYVTDFVGGSIFKVEIAKNKFTNIATAIPESPNGIIFDEENNRCVFVCWVANAPIKAIDLTSFDVTNILTTSNNSCDGIAKDASGNFYISVWGSESVLQYDHAFANPPITIASGLSSPADIFVNVEDNVLGIPNSGNNTVTFVDLEDFGVAVSKEDEIKNIKIFPNPMKTNAYIDFGAEKSNPISSEIINMHGDKVKSIDSHTIQNGKMLIDVSDMNAGIYYFVYKTENGSKTIPLLIAK